MIARILDEWILLFVLHFHSYLRTFRAFWRLPDLPGYLYFILFLWNRIGLRDSWMSGYDFLFCIFILIYALSGHFGEYLICPVIFILYCFYEIGLRDSWTSALSGYDFLFLHFHSHLCTFCAFRRIPFLPGYL